MFFNSSKSRGRYGNDMMGAESRASEFCERIQFFISYYLIVLFSFFKVREGRSNTAIGINGVL